MAAREHAFSKLAAWLERELGFARRRFDARTAVILTTAAVALLVFKRFGGSSHFAVMVQETSFASHPKKAILGDFYWFVSCFVLLGLLPLMTALLVWGTGKGHSLGLGIGLGDKKAGLVGVLLLYAVMIGPVILVSQSPDFYRYYPLSSQIAQEAQSYIRGQGPTDFPLWFASYEALYALYFVGWEYFYRGFLVFGCYRALGVSGIFAANLPFALMHAGKPFLEGLGSVAAGVALGLFALRTRSFWYCWLLHALTAITMDFLAIGARFSAQP